MRSEQETMIHAKCLLCGDWLEADIRAVREMIGQARGRLPRTLPLPCVACTETEFGPIGDDPVPTVMTYHTWIAC